MVIQVLPLNSLVESLFPHFFTAILINFFCGFTAENVTTWGYSDVARDYRNKSFGGHSKFFFKSDVVKTYILYNFKKYTNSWNAACLTTSLITVSTLGSRWAHRILWRLIRTSRPNRISHGNLNVRRESGSNGYWKERKEKNSLLVFLIWSCPCLSVCLMNECIVPTWMAVAISRTTLIGVANLYYGPGFPPSTFINIIRGSSWKPEGIKVKE